MAVAGLPVDELAQDIHVAEMGGGVLDHVDEYWVR